MFCETLIVADTTEVASFEVRYGSAFSSYVLRESDDALIDALELGKMALAERHSLLELVAVHHKLLAIFVGQSSGHVETHQRFTRAQEFLARVTAPYELAHHRWHEMAD